MELILCHKKFEETFERCQDCAETGNTRCLAELNISVGKKSENRKRNVMVYLHQKLERERKYSEKKRHICYSEEATYIRKLISYCGKFNGG